MLAEMAFFRLWNLRIPRHTAPTTAGISWTTGRKTSPFPALPGGPLGAHRQGSGTCSGNRGGRN